jgi:transcriptional regulator ATRX
VKMEDKHEEVEDIESGLSDSFIDDDDDDDDDEDSNNDDDNEPSTSGQDDGTRIQVSLFFFFSCFLITVKC